MKLPSGYRGATYSSSEIDRSDQVNLKAEVTQLKILNMMVTIDSELMKINFKTLKLGIFITVYM